MPSTGRAPSRVILNTGHGKGKSSSAFGVMARGWARGWTVGVVQFVKGGKWKTGERKLADHLGIGELAAFGLGELHAVLDEVPEDLLHAISINGGPVGLTLSGTALAKLGLTAVDVDRATGKIQAFAADHILDGGGLAKGGEVTLFVDGEPVGTGRVERTEPGRFSAEETCDLGVDLGSVVSPDYQPGTNAFTGSVAWAQIDVGDLDPEHQALEHQLHLTVAHGTQ